MPSIPRLPETERIERAAQFFAGRGADIREGGSRAFYSPAEDYIQMPPFAVFKKADFRYSVLAHEAGNTIEELQRDCEGTPLFLLIADTHS